MKLKLLRVDKLRQLLEGEDDAAEAVLRSLN